MTQSPLMHEFLAGRVVVVTGDITDLAVDAVVNAANSTLLGGGGVDGAIHRRGGPAILEACREIRRTQYPDGLPAGEAVITTAGKLPSQYVIHTVGPIWGTDPDPEGLLASCYRNCIGLADSRGLAELAFPAISTGAYGYPKAQAARTASLAITATLASCRTVRRIQLVFFAAADAEIFVRHQQF
ncbi:MAG TPA: O-acetyl-ADP-ribose deacetylase [Steroidobacteraceae bacterium]|jgi:O-acetyl-ADP-ribose deacetylase (regulator of RNase III)